ncbi:MAG: IS110 family transposase [Myxococcota bacterium]|nr:IS110 family transposase [Myxococcota bacterium]
MRSVGLDLGARHIAWCEVVDGTVTRRGSVRRLDDLEPLLGLATAPARVAFEASREAWHVHDVMVGWDKQPVLLDTTRIRQIGVGQHGRKNDSIDAEAIAMAMDAGRVPVAHVLSPERRVLRAKLSVRGELVEMRARQVTLLRGLARAAGVLIPSSSTDTFLQKLQQAPIDESTRALMAPLVATLTVAQKQLAEVDAQIAHVAKADSIIRLCATVPGVAVIVAATFVSVIDEAKRFRNAHAVSAYLGLVPGESTTGGKQRLGSITKRGNTHARAMLVQSAWLILRARDTGDPLRRWATDLAKTRGKKIAAVALARKLAGVLWAMWRDGTVYDPGFQARESTKGLHADAQSHELRAQAMALVAKKIQRLCWLLLSSVALTPRRGNHDEARQAQETH